VAKGFFLTVPRFANSYPNWEHVSICDTREMIHFEFVVQTLSVAGCLGFWFGVSPHLFPSHYAGEDEGGGLNDLNDWNVWNDSGHGRPNHYPRRVVNNRRRREYQAKELRREG
jgi:hypothetical protein